MVSCRIRPLVPTEVCMRVIDFVAIREEAIWDVSYNIWCKDVYETLQACSLTCHAWRPRSQFHLMQLMSVRPSLMGSRSFDDMSALFNNIPLLKNNIEYLNVSGKEIKIPRFHLVPFKIYETLPLLQALILSNGFLYLPTPFLVCIRRFARLTELRLYRLTLLSDNDLRRMLGALRNLQRLDIRFLEWSTTGSKVQCQAQPRPTLQSCVRLRFLRIRAESQWITDTRTIRFFDWLSSSRVLSEIEQIHLPGIMLIDDKITTAMSRLIHAAQTSPRVDSVVLNLGPSTELAALYSPLASLPKLTHLHFRCPYDGPILVRLADLLSTILSRPEEAMHSQIHLSLDQYPHHTEPPLECWEKLDSILQKEAMRVDVRCEIIRVVNLDKPVVWGDYYKQERRNGWAEEVKKLFPKACREGRLWTVDCEGISRNLRCE
ncbi:hypothetical protein PHLGIDRAFT_387786 [Phlebiopsis gigantea 11061_1 CR5-6]|uniref:F-box domain-containing protein n=1 Tax=Phlebiopsis gigantea (strain 11061_1 CR5-6) TaxID=745531 RepID=A0A0C3S9F0_PHLG1|nr:hypothetical protein PHLGIDRAFT_387786 [Phlebiopsis gigantea 11061_1 CR5-6]